MLARARLPRPRPPCLRRSTRTRVPLRGWYPRAPVANDLSHCLRWRPCPAPSDPVPAPSISSRRRLRRALAGLRRPRFRGFCGQPQPVSCFVWIWSRPPRIRYPPRRRRQRDRPPRLLLARPHRPRLASVGSLSPLRRVLRRESFAPTGSFATAVVWRESSQSVKNTVARPRSVV
jgi:hypothetical protein